MWYITVIFGFLVIVQTAYAIGIDPIVDTNPDLTIKTCGQFLDEDGLLCPEGYIYNIVTAAVSVDDAADFNAKCCVEVVTTVDDLAAVEIKTCGQLFDGDGLFCSEGFIYSVASAAISVEDSSNFNAECCISIVNTVDNTVDAVDTLLSCTAARVLGGQYVCTGRRVFNVLSVLSISTEAEYDGSCCRDPHCDEATNDIVFACGANRVYSPLSDLTVEISSLAEYDSKCCAPEEVLCSEALLRADYTCATGRTFNLASAATVVSGVENFDRVCCRDSFLCGQLLNTDGDTCPEGKIYNPLSVNAILGDGGTFESTCCIDMVCANAVLRDGYTCPGVSTYNVLSDAVRVTGLADFQNSCCLDLQCARAVLLDGYDCTGDRVYDPISDLAILGSADEYDQTCCSDMTCLQALLTDAYACAGVRVYSPLLDSVLLPSVSDYDARCCEDATKVELKTCASVADLDGIMCPEGRIYRPASAAVELERTAHFDYGCCEDVQLEIPVCAQELGVVGAVCLNGGVYNPLSAAVFVPSMDEFSDNCCHPKEKVDCNSQVSRCQGVAGLIGSICLDGRVYDPLSAENAISVGLDADFDAICCKTVEVDVRICAQGVGAGYSCGEGQLYDPLKAGLLAPLAEDFALSCCKDILNSETPVEVCSQALGRGGFLCGNNRVYSPYLASIALGSGSDYDANCCMDVQVDVQVCAQGLGVLGFECPSGTKYNPLTANALLSRAGDFASLCCEEDTECEPVCNDNPINTCVDALGLKGFLCGDGRVYSPLLALLPLSEASNFDSACCDTDPNLKVDLCAGVLGVAGYVCLDGSVYSPDFADNVVSDASDFNGKCCTVTTVVNEVTECVQALGISGYSCGEGRVYDPTSALVGVALTADFDQLCCQDDMSSLVQVCAQVLGVIGNSCSTGRQYNPLSLDVELLGDKTFDELCCEPIPDYNSDVPDCQPACNEPGLQPTCVEALGLTGYNCGLDRVYRLNLADVLLSSADDFDTKCCGPPECSQALNLAGFLCANGHIYDPDSKDLEVTAKADFDTQCCEQDTSVNILACGDVLGVAGFSCTSGRVFDPLRILDVVDEAFDSSCCKDSLLALDAQLCVQALGLGDYTCDDGNVYNPLKANVGIALASDFQEACCKQDVEVKVSTCLSVLGLIDYSCGPNRKFTPISLSLQLTGPEDFDANCCEDIGSGSYNPDLPDCTSALGVDGVGNSDNTTVVPEGETPTDPDTTSSPQSCNAARADGVWSCSSQDMYDYPSNESQVSDLSEYRTLCCKEKPCMTLVSKGRVLSVDQVCIRPTEPSSGGDGGAAPADGGANSTDSSGAGGTGNTTSDGGASTTPEGDTSGGTSGSGGTTDGSTTGSTDTSSSGDSSIRIEPRMCKSLIDDLDLCKDSLCTNVGIDPNSAACVCNGEFENDPYCNACTVNGCDQCVASANGEEIYRPRINDQFGLEDNLGLSTPLAIGRWCVECNVHDIANVWECTQCQDDVGCISGIDLTTNLPAALTSSDIVPMKWVETGTRSLFDITGPNWVLARCDGTEDAGVCFDQQSYVEPSPLR
ncbi:hypothetical protein SARC_01954 [Sphaeroforma arctica JP610]|uniref:Uncharacterized protein n=1 Tax=Sphaeroforma arctica JP610 TaxID=667725 RepID=A0A0L0GC85_9EUKA|nr:hypothetical protein SARC_01954 [Sphaeroforma arctica JP610]KNC85878.1 hypothetical protein SARC_01954 [Sphaeroforma arctica JP610]|eukprot:XP_014159780.1 hypothetical protein SARC_01954 [Sphaeroforma arctica JP610]